MRGKNSEISLESKFRALLYWEAGYTAKVAGDILGKHRSTINHRVDVIKGWIDTYPEIREKWEHYRNTHRVPRPEPQEARPSEPDNIIDLCCEAKEMIFHGFSLQEVADIQGISTLSVFNRFKRIKDLTLNEVQERGRAAIIARYKAYKLSQEERAAA